MEIDISINIFIVGDHKVKEITNPILPGFNPDPSIIRIEDDFYIATSTFEWYPGVQIHHSKDLTNWKLITRPLNRNSQLNMLGEANSCGVWAPCLSFNNGIFYLVYTDVKESGTTHNYLVTTTDITGNWSDPIYLDSRGFDPSIFHDDDGKKWYTVMYFDHLTWNYLISGNEGNFGDEVSKRFETQYKKYNKPYPLFKGIMMQEYSETEKKLVGEVKKIFGNEVGITEGPHQYKKDGYYYLLMAEGGTSYEHCVTLARSKKIEGPYEVHPQNPLFCSNNTDAYLQKTGHADFVETQDGSIYMVHLCSRPLDLKNRQGSVLGRETAIQKMKWDEDGWLRLADGKSVASEKTEAPNLPEFKFPTEPVKDDFDSENLNINFQWLRGDISHKIFSLTARDSHLRLYGKNMIVSNYEVSLVARRQQSFNYEASTSVEFNPDDENQMAGLVVMYSNNLYYYLYIGLDYNIGPYLSVMSNDRKKINLFECAPIPIGQDRKIFMKADVQGKKLQFYYSQDNNSYQKIGPVLDMMKLTDEHSRGFTGAFVGMCCNDPATRKAYADFDYFEYIEK